MTSEVVSYRSVIPVYRADASVPVVRSVHVDVVNLIYMGYEGDEYEASYRMRMMEFMNHRDKDECPVVVIIVMVVDGNFLFMGKDLG